MRHQGNGLARMFLHKNTHSLQHALAHGLQALTLGWSKRGIVLPRLQYCCILCSSRFYFPGRQAFPLSEVVFDKCLVACYFQIVALCDSLSGLVGSLEGAAIDGGDRQAGQRFSEMACLQSACFCQCIVTPPNIAHLTIEHSLSVTY